MKTVFRISPLPEKLACFPWPPTLLTQKCRFCNFQAVFGHFAQIAPLPSSGHFVQIAPPLPPAPVNPIWETLVLLRFSVASL